MTNKDRIAFARQLAQRNVLRSERIMGLANAEVLAAELRSEGFDTAVRPSQHSGEFIVSSWKEVL